SVSTKVSVISLKVRDIGLAPGRQWPLVTLPLTRARRKALSWGPRRSAYKAWLLASLATRSLRPRFLPLTGSCPRPGRGMVYGLSPPVTVGAHRRPCRPPPRRGGVLERPRRARPSGRAGGAEDGSGGGQVAAAGCRRRRRAASRMSQANSTMIM